MWHNELGRPSPLAFLARGSSRNFPDAEDRWLAKKLRVCTHILPYLGMS